MSPAMRLKKRVSTGSMTPRLTLTAARVVRKAYKKLALQTHPDRLPPGASPADKAATEEKFRKVRTLVFALIGESD